MKSSVIISVGWFFLVSLSFGSGFSQDILKGFTIADIGNPALPGTVEYNTSDQSIVLTGSGYNIWFDRDEFVFYSVKVTGDFIFSTNPAFISKGVNAHRKIGLMARNSYDESSAYIDAVVHGDGLTSMQYRDKETAETREEKTSANAPDFVQLERKGNRFVMRISKNNQPLEEVASLELNLMASLRLGLFICSHDEKIVESAIFRNTRLDIPAPEKLGDNAGSAPSRLEILDIETGTRKIVYETNSHIEAPNWSPDGNYLVYNSEGRLFRFNLETRMPRLIDTDFATSCNNDHGISFDGKMLAISHHHEENGQRNSIIFTLPVAGGMPVRVTEKGPSYWHGWSPDGKYLVYCAERNGNYDVYKIPSAGGKEIRLTTAEGLDDGPEYSPDGKYIYFNSVRSGSMKIWRMKSDGAGQEQVSTGEYQDWFAHPSPDGNWLLFISYLPEVPAGSHPGNKCVMLRLMPSTGDNIKTLAFLYGGQGTINVPSWSPDSKKVAFVSYSY